jgi:uncharacterized protein
MRVLRRNSLSIIALLSVVAVGAAGADVRLADAVQNGDAATVRALLKLHVDVNATQVDGMTALGWAAHNDDIETAELLVRAGANAKLANRYGISPLSEAATNGNAALIEMLLKAGADPNTTLPEGDTVLMLASRTGKVDAVKALLDHNAQVNAKEGWHGETALIWAAGENHPDVIRLLIEHGADPNAQATHLIYPEMKAAPAQVLSKLPTGGLTALMTAAREGSVEAAQALLKGGANPNQRDPNNLSALLIAISNAHFDLANVLIENGADVNDGSLAGAVDVRNSVVLRAATNRADELGPMDIVKSLLAHGAKPDSALSNPIPAKKALGGAPNAPMDAPAFYRAAKFTDLEVMRLLLDKGASATHALKDGSTPLMVASGLGAKGPQSLEFEKKVSEEDMITAVKLCLYHGADINAADGTGMTALHGAAQKGADQVVQYLADRGAKLDLKDKRERTALDVASGVAAGPPGGGGGAQRPPTVHESTAALLRKLMGLPADAKPAETKVSQAKPQDENKPEAR